MSQGTSANARVNHVVRLDGSVRIVGVWRSPMLGWESSVHLWLTGDALDAMRRRCVRVVLLRRGFRKVEVPLSWLIAEQTASEPIGRGPNLAVHIS